MITYLQGAVLSTRERILEAAYELFSRKGYLGTTTREVAHLAGVSEVTLFRLFKSKKDLFREVLISYSVIPDIRSLSVSGGSGKEVLVEIGKKIFFSLREKREFIKILLSEVTGLTDDASEVYSQFVETLESLLENVFSSVLLDFSEDEFSTRVRIFGSALFGFFISEEILQGKKVPLEDVDRFIEVLSQSVSGGKS